MDALFPILVALLIALVSLAAFIVFEWAVVPVVICAIALVGLALSWL